MPQDSPTLQFIGWLGYKIYQEADSLLMYAHLLVAALFPIYISCHASLRRPPSAAPRRKKISSGAAGASNEEDDDDEVEPPVEKLSISDAILFPVIASVVLGGLYLLIKWLEDPALLNKILGWYYSGIGVIGVGRLVADALNVATTFIFPLVWSSKGKLYYIEPLISRQCTGSPVAGSRMPHRRDIAEDLKTPFPGALAKLKLLDSSNKLLWSLRAIFTDHWIFRGYLHGAMAIKSNVRLNDIIGFMVGLTTVLFYNLGGKAWWAQNVLGFGFCYGTVQLLSPTSVCIGTILLSGLFIYDVIMVFYTPLMVTVATSIDAPIMLRIPGPKRGSMLGLGDIIIPAIVMALALRFDLYLHYLRKKKVEEVASIAQGDCNTHKAVYEGAIGNWGERFWTRGIPDKELPSSATGGKFSKVYFNASLVGYVIGMLCTLIVLNIFQHAQPALLYLVPAILGSLWGTAAIRGELKLMWEYTEDGSLEEGFKKANEKGDSGKNDQEKKNEDAMEKKGDGEVQVKGDKNHTKEKSKRNIMGIEDKEKDQFVFLFSLSWPKRGPPMARISEE